MNAIFLTARGLSATRTGLVAACFGAGVVVGGPLLGTLADRLGRRPALLQSLGARALWLACLVTGLAVAAGLLALGRAHRSPHSNHPGQQHHESANHAWRHEQSVRDPNDRS